MALTGEEEELASALRPALPHLLRTGSSSSPFYCPFSKVGQNVLRRFTSDGKLPSLLEELDHAPCGGSFKSEAALYQHVHALARQEEELHAILLSVIDQQPTQTPAHKRPKLELPPIEGEEVPMPLMLLIDFSTKDFDSAGKLKELFKGFQPDMHLPKYLPNHCTGEVLLVWFDVIKLSDAQVCTPAVQPHHLVPSNAQLVRCRTHSRCRCSSIRTSVNITCARRGGPLARTGPFGSKSAPNGSRSW